MSKNVSKDKLPFENLNRNSSLDKQNGSHSTNVTMRQPTTISPQTKFALDFQGNKASYLSNKHESYNSKHLFSKAGASSLSGSNPKYLSGIKA